MFWRRRTRGSSGDRTALCARSAAVETRPATRAIGDRGSMPTGSRPSLDVTERKALVAHGYERIAARYTAAKDDRDDIQGWLTEMAALLPSDGSVLDAGCGAAVPYTRRLSATQTVVGLDLARAQARLARVNIAGGRVVQGDICALPFATASFDGALSLYAIIHVPRMEHAGVLVELARVLRPGAPLLVVLGARPTADDWGEYHGAPMYWSHFGAAVSRRLVEGAGFSVLRCERVADREGGGHTFVLGRRTEHRLPTAAREG